MQPSFSSVSARSLFEMVFQLISQINFLRSQALIHQRCGVLYPDEIEAILDQIKAGDAEGARQATRRHIASACSAAQELASATCARVLCSDTHVMGLRVPSGEPGGHKGRLPRPCP